VRHSSPSMQECDRNNASETAAFIEAARRWFSGPWPPGPPDRQRVFPHQKPRGDIATWRSSAGPSANSAIRIAPSQTLDLRTRDTVLFATVPFAPAITHARLVLFFSYPPKVSGHSSEARDCLVPGLRLNRGFEAWRCVIAVRLIARATGKLSTAAEKEARKRSKPAYLGGVLPKHGHGDEGMAKCLLDVGWA
jgi:hypothetical protein